MKAIQFDQFGGSDVLKLIELERPRPNDYEVLIEIKAIGVNYADTARRRGQYVTKTPLPYIPGLEVAGVIIETGEKVENVKIGSRVVTLLGNRSSGYAEYTVAPAQLLIPIPDEMDDATAVAIPLQGLTAYHILKTSGQMKPGESVVVHAAAGGVGTLAVQMAKYYGAGKVIATASTSEKLRLAESFGADVLINYTESDWVDQVLQATGGKGADIILEMVGGEMIGKNLDCLASFGRMVVYGAASGERGTLIPAQLMRKCQSVVGFFLTEILNHPALYASSLKELLAMISEGKLTPIIGGRFPLEDAAKVHDLLEGRQTTGKLVLIP